MDKRTLLFVGILALTLFFVNMYFDHQRQDDLRAWNEKTKASRELKTKQLEAEIASETAKPEELPLVELFADSEGKQFLTSGVQTEKGILTLSWTDQLPETVYFRKNKSKEALQPSKLAFSSKDVSSPALYIAGQGGKLAVGLLPEFGKFKLQMVGLSPQNTVQPFSIALGNYEDGQISIPAKQLEQLQAEDAAVQGTEARPSQPFGNRIVLFKADKGYMPVAVYQPAQNTLTDLEQIPGLDPYLNKPEVKMATVAENKGEEKFYVIETPYQQLVFSNYGGALAEINLPFMSGTDSSSVVRQVEFDRDMLSKHPYNAHFPAHAYTEVGSDGKQQEQAAGKLGGFYPLIRRDLIQSKNQKSIRVPPQFYALNIVSEYPELAELVYQVKEFTKNKIVFEAQQRNRRITKTYSVDPTVDAPYALNLTVAIDGDSRGLWLTSGVPEVELISGTPAPTLKYRITRNDKNYVEAIDLPPESTTVTSVYPDWICNSNGFFGTILDPLTKTDPGYRAQFVSGTMVPSRLVELDENYGRFKAADLPGYMTLLPLKSDGGVMQFRIFAGPFAGSVLKAADTVYTDPATGTNPDYVACQSFHGWFTFISEPFAKFLGILIKFFYSVTGSWGFSIILLTIALRVMMYPLNAWSTKSMVRMQQIAPEVAAIQEKFKKDPRKGQLEVMNLYRERGVNPMSGCFPMLIQMPFLIGMFDLLKSMFELRGASFIPGWIDDLTAPDVLFSWKTPIMFIGTQFHLLPIILGVVMFMQQRMMSTAPSDPALMTDQQRQQRTMGTMMSILFTFMFYNFPSGLNIYWLSSMFLGMLQQWWTTKTLKATPAPVTVLVDKGPRKKK